MVAGVGEILVRTARAHGLFGLGVHVAPIEAQVGRTLLHVDGIAEDGKGRIYAARLESRDAGLLEFRPVKR